MDKIELIDRAAVRALAYRSSDWSHGEHPLVVELGDIDDLPTIDAAPVRRGEWVNRDYITTAYGHIDCADCTNCGETGIIANGHPVFC